MSDRPSRKRKSPSETEFKQPFQFRRGSYWSDREIFCLTLGLQRYGFCETKKIAEFIRTKDENAVKHYLSTEVGKIRCNAAREKCLPIRGGGSWYHPSPVEVKNWPVIRKWRRMMYNQMLPCVRNQDYSKIVMEDLLRSFYEEAEEPSDPQVANFKAIYKFLLDCFCGRVPAELSPIDSCIVLALTGTLGQIRNELNLTEEIKFLENFKKATTFAPIKLKSEFKEKTKKRTKRLGNALKVKLSSTVKLDPVCIPSTSRSSTVDTEAIPGPSHTAKKSNTVKNISGLFNIKVESMENDSPLSDKQSKTIPTSSKVKSENSSDVPEVGSEIVVSTAVEPEYEEADSDWEDNAEDDVVEEIEDDGNTIKIPEEIYVNLSKHRKVVQSFNPLNVPMWTLVTEQAYIQNKCDMI